MNDNYNKRKIFDIFNKLQLVPKPKKENNEQNSIEYFNSINISDNHSVGKKIIKIPINNAKSIQSNNKDSFEINISTKINTNKKEYNFLFNKPITPAQYNTYLDANSKFKKGINTKKNITTKNIIENESISCYNKNYNIKKFNKKIKKY